MSLRPRLGLFAAGLSLCLAALAAVWLLTAGPDRAPSSGFAPEAFLPGVPPRGKICIPREVVPAGARGVQLTLGANGRQAGTSVRVTGTRAKRRVLTGQRSFVEDQNVFVPIARASASQQVVTLCITNTGTHTFQVGGKPGLGPSIRYPGATTTTWARGAGSIADRFRYVRFAPFGAATLWVFLALALGAVLAGVVALIRVART